MSEPSAQSGTGSKPPNNTSSERLSEAQTRKAELDNLKLESEIEIAREKAKLENLKTLFPASTTKPLEGKITVDDKFGYVAEQFAYKALEKAAVQVTGAINVNADAKILIVDTLDFCGDDIQLLEIEGQLDTWQKEFEAMRNIIAGLIKKVKESVIKPKPLEIDRTAAEISIVEGAIERGTTSLVSKFSSKFIPFAAGTAATVISGTVNALTNLVGYFNTDYDIKGREIKAENKALFSFVAGKLESAGTFLPGFCMIKNSGLIDKLNSVIKTVIKLKSEQDVLSMALLYAEKMIDETDEENAEEIEKTKKKLAELKTASENAVSKSEKLVQTFDEFIKSVTTVQQGQTMSSFAKAVYRKQLFTEGITHILYLAVVSSGGHFVTRHNFFFNPRISFYGGVVVNFIMAETSGKIVKADTVVKSCTKVFMLKRKDKAATLDEFDFDKT